MDGRCGWGGSNDQSVSQSNHFVEEWMLKNVDVQDGESACDLIPSLSQQGCSVICTPVPTRVDIRSKKYRSEIGSALHNNLTNPSCKHELYIAR